MRGAPRLKYLIILLFISTFTKAANNTVLKEPKLYNSIHYCTSLEILPGNDSEAFKWNKKFNKSGFILKKRSTKKRGIAGSVSFICDHTIVKTFTYSEFKPHYLQVNFISFLRYSRFNKGPPMF